jgi:hypothetical protein
MTNPNDGVELTSHGTPRKRPYTTRTPKGPRKFTEKDGNCYRCGAALRRKIFTEPVLCAECRNLIRFFQRHPGIPDPIDWHYPPAREKVYAPASAGHDAPAEPEQTALTMAEPADDLTDQVRADLRNELHGLDEQITQIGIRRGELRTEDATARQRIREIAGELATIRNEEDRITARINVVYAALNPGRNVN